MAFPAVAGLAAIALWLAEIGALIAKLFLSYVVLRFTMRSLAIVLLIGIFAQFIFAIEDLLESIVVPSIPSQVFIVLSWLPAETNVYLGVIASTALLAVQLRLSVALWNWWTRGIL